jgi:hypothetical protein
VGKALGAEQTAAAIQHRGIMGVGVRVNPTDDQRVLKLHAVHAVLSIREGGPVGKGGQPRVMAKARTGEGCERRLTTLQLRRLNFRSVPVAVGWDFCAWLRSATQDGSWLESRCGQRFAAQSRAQGRRAGRPGWPVRRRPVRRRPARRPRTSGRASRRGPPTPAGTATDRADIVGLRERNAHRRATDDGRARQAGGGGFGAGAAHIQHRPLAGRPCRRSAGPIPAVVGRSSESTLPGPRRRR